jgi:hypothetical protein
LDGFENLILKEIHPSFKRRTDIFIFSYGAKTVAVRTRRT